MQTDRKTDTLKRLGPVKYWRGERKFMEAMEEMYRKAVEKSIKALDLKD